MVPSIMSSICPVPTAAVDPHTPMSPAASRTVVIGEGAVTINCSPPPPAHDEVVNSDKSQNVQYRA
jgi:hypothetical protein